MELTKKLTPEQRKALHQIASKGGKTTMRRLGKEGRSRLGKLGAAAHWKKYREKKAEIDNPALKI